MSCTVEGGSIPELVDKLESMFSDKEIKDLQKNALKPVADEIKSSMKGVAPVCNLPEVHGRDAIGFRYVGSRGYVIGLDNQTKDVSGDYWNITRGLWYSQWGGGNNYKHLGWFTDFCNRNRSKFLNDAEKQLKIAIQDKLNSIR